LNSMDEAVEVDGKKKMLPRVPSRLIIRTVKHFDRQQKSQVTKGGLPRFDYGSIENIYIWS